MPCTGGVSNRARGLGETQRRRNLSPWAIGGGGVWQNKEPWLSGLQGQARPRKRCCTSTCTVLVNPKGVSVMLGEMRRTDCRARHLHSSLQIFCDIPQIEPTGGGEPPTSISHPTLLSFSTDHPTIHKVFGCLGAKTGPFRGKL